MSVMMNVSSLGSKAQTVVDSATQLSKSYESYAWFAVANFFSAGVTALLACAWGLYSLSARVEQAREKNPEAPLANIAQEAFKESLSGVEKYALWMFAKLSGFGAVSDALSLAGSLAAATRAKGIQNAVSGAYSAVAERFGSVSSFASQIGPQVLELSTKTTTSFFDSMKGVPTSEQVGVSTGEAFVPPAARFSERRFAESDAIGGGSLLDVSDPFGVRGVEDPNFDIFGDNSF